ncbi:hypothetical protein MUK60_24480 [Streptomyces sp. LRE541]|uniref:hypothetical protein n=1 Tax=Streptomyces sp. LRE541 TaxID=2931983 RepID=UPI00200FB506|nr:hypothetical protein [Streptomyces sp. LRE541]UPZ30654.1 hypothetical protein MUK60_24480 [Streptomyces sp. LRE541]
MNKDDNASGGIVFSGIDPDALKGTIDSVSRDQETLQTRASYYKTELAYYGLGAEELQDILHVASWARDELPMLKRRYHLSMNMDNSPFPGFKGMVQINEARVTRAANAAAARDAKRATNLAKKDPEDLTPEELDELTTLFALNHDQYPFAEKVVGALGAEKTLRLWYGISNLGSAPGYGRPSDFKSSDALDEVQKNLSLTVAAATNSDAPAMVRWKKDMVALGGNPIAEPGPPPYGGSGGPKGFLVMSNLMRFGDYDDKFLEDYGTALVKEDKQVLNGPGPAWGATGRLNHVGNDKGNDPLTGYMKALSNSPAAATVFFTAKHKNEAGKPESNFKYLFESREWPNDSKPGEESVTGRNSLGHALEAAMTGHRPGEQATTQTAKHTKAQADLFSSLVSSVSQDQDLLRNHEYLSDSFANISAEYMPDLHQSLNYNANNSHKLYPTSGTPASLDTLDTVRFLHTVARNSEGYDHLNVSQHAFAAALMEAQAKHPGLYPLSTDIDASTAATIDKIAFQTGLFQGVIHSGQYFQTEKDGVEVVERNNAWKEHASTWGGSLVGSATAITTASFTGPGGIVAGGLAGTAAEEIFSGILNGFGDDEEQEDRQVYQNVKRTDKIQHSVIVTTQESAKIATGKEADENRVGDEAFRGFSNADSLIRNSKAELPTN